MPTDRLTVNGTALRAAADQLDAAARLPWRLEVDAAASGSAAVTRAIDDLTMWVSASLLELTGRTADLGVAARAAAGAFDEADSHLAAGLTGGIAAGVSAR